MRYSLLAGGKRIRPGAVAGDGALDRRRARDGAAGRRRDRADPHLLADPRRPARRWTTTSCAAGCRPRTSSTARTSRSSPATGSSPRRCASSASSQQGDPDARRRRARRAGRRDRGERNGRRPVRGRDDLRPAAGREGVGRAPDPAALREMHALKTGRLIAASVGVVLQLGDVSEAATIPYRRFADELGVLFQIVDDILDVTGSDEELGKPSGSDERHGKLTYVSAFGLDRARELASESHAQRPRGARRGRHPDRRPRPDHRLHPHPRHMSRHMSDKTDQSGRARQRGREAPADGRRGPRRPAPTSRRRAPAARPGGPRADHRHDRRDRRPLRRQPRHLRAGGRAPPPARLAARQDPLGRRPPGLSRTRS